MKYTVKGKPEARNELSDTVSKDMKSRGFKFLGSVTVFGKMLEIQRTKFVKLHYKVV